MKGHFVGTDQVFDALLSIIPFYLSNKSLRWVFQAPLHRWENWALSCINWVSQSSGNEGEQGFNCKSFCIHASSGLAPTYKAPSSAFCHWNDLSVAFSHSGQMAVNLSPSHLCFSIFKSSDFPWSWIWPLNTGKINHNFSLQVVRDVLNQHLPSPLDGCFGCFQPFISKIKMIPNCSEVVMGPHTTVWPTQRSIWPSRAFSLGQHGSWCPGHKSQPNERPHKYTQEVKPLLRV